MLQLPVKYLRHCYARMQNLASDAQLLPPPPFSFLISLHRPCPKHCSTVLKRRGGTWGGGIGGCFVGRGNTNFCNNFAANCRYIPLCDVLSFCVLYDTLNMDLSLTPAHQHTFWQLMSGSTGDELCSPTLLTEMLKSFPFARYFRPCFQLICRRTTHSEG